MQEWWRPCDGRIFDDTLAEMECGWAEGPFSMEDLEPGAANDSFRYALMRGCGLGHVASELIQFPLDVEVPVNLCTSFARVPTETHLSDQRIAATQSIEPIVSLRALGFGRACRSILRAVFQRRQCMPGPMRQERKNGRHGGRTK